MQKSVLVAVLVLIPMSYADAQIPPIERNALIALYNSTDGANWLFNNNWLAAAGTECSWYGVTCDGEHVQELHLSFNWLSGSIPPELGNLSALEDLDLNQNILSGSIPAELGNLSNLSRLILYANPLSGGIPPELGDLASLQQLWLYGTNVGGSIPPELGSLANLTYLNLSSNQLTGSIPPELGDLAILRELDLTVNQLTGSIPPELGNLANLLKLYLHTNMLSGIPAELGNLSSLQQLYLYDNQLSGAIPPELGDLASLQKLWLFDNQLSGSIPPQLGDLSDLEWLYLDSNKLSGSIPPELGSLANLTYLHLNNNQLSGAIPLELGNLASLRRLYLLSNQLSGAIPPELGNLSLNALDIRWNALHSNNASLIVFLNYYGDWQSTQTIAPVNLTYSRVGDHTVWLSWDTVSYSDPGGYEVFSAPTGTGVWTSGGWTEAKTDITHPLTGLDPGTIYDLAVLTYTAPHADNLNLVHSDFSLQVTETTTSNSCAQPVIEQAGVDPITLSLSASWDSYLWSTGATDPSIVVDPQLWKWYLVTVTSTGPCEETASTWVGQETPVFADGFESGDTSKWSLKVP